MPLSPALFKGGVGSFIDATGGTETTTGGYKYHTFLNPASIASDPVSDYTYTFTINAIKGKTVEVFLVGGGQAGVEAGPGGGGANATYLLTTSLDAGTYTVTVAGYGSTSRLEKSGVVNVTATPYGGTSSGGTTYYNGGAPGSSTGAAGGDGGNGAVCSEFSAFSGGVIPEGGGAEFEARAGGGGGGGGNVDGSPPYGYPGGNGGLAGGAYGGQTGFTSGGWPARGTGGGGGGGAWDPPGDAPRNPGHGSTGRVVIRYAA